MRISTPWSQQVAVNAILDQQAKLNRLQLQLSTQKRILAPSDDPSSSALILDISHSIDQTEQYQSNIHSAQQRLELEQGTLQSSVDAVQRIRELAVQGLNATYGKDDRAAVATEIGQLKDELLGLANTRNANGEYIFSGFKTAAQPFSANAAGGYDYNGDANLRSIQIGVTRQIADSSIGTDVFGTPSGLAPAAQTAGGIGNAFEAIDKLAADLNANTPNAGSLDDISSALDKLLTAQASVGARLNALDRQQSLHEDSVVSHREVLSATEDLDVVDAISKFTQQATALDAAQQAFNKVKNLSLFNYLS